MIKSIYFDLDGTLVDSKKLHFDALNTALAIVDYKYRITPEEQGKIYEGLTTRAKLDHLVKNKNFPLERVEETWKYKQLLTSFNKVRENPDLIRLFHTLKRLGFTIYVASNCTFISVKNLLIQLGLCSLVDWFVSNDDVKEGKPSGEIYRKCLERNKVTGEEVLVIEDSAHGIESARSAGCNYWQVEGPWDLTEERVLAQIERLQSKRGNIVIPMAGEGIRFKNAGWEMPKPLTMIQGIPMIDRVIDNVGGFLPGARFIFIIREEHEEKYQIRKRLFELAPGCKIFSCREVTEGSVCSVLLAKGCINNEHPLLIANADQLVRGSTDLRLLSTAGDGVISCFQTTDRDNRWSYVNLEGQRVVAVREKEVLSDMATTGIYFWNKGEDYVRYAEEMIANNERVNGEFYNAPVYNLAIREGKKIRAVCCQNFIPLGTPEDVLKVNN